MSIVDSIYFAFKVYGIVIVISFLCAFVIWAVVHTLSAVAQKGQAPAPQAKPEPAPAPVPVAAAPAVASSEPSAAAGDVPLEHVAAIAAAMVGSVPLEHVAAIAAAVATLADGATVLRIEDNGRHTAWVAEGRLAHHSSHSPIRNR